MAGSAFGLAAAVIVLFAVETNRGSEPVDGVIEGREVSMPTSPGLEGMQTAASGDESIPTVAPGPPSRLYAETRIGSLDDPTPLIDRLDALKRLALAGDAHAATTLAHDLLDCRTYLRALQQIEDTFDMRDPVMRSASEARYEALILSNEQRETACRGLPIPSIAELIEWTELAASMGDAGAMVTYIHVTISRDAADAFARGEVAEFARVRNRQIEFNRQAALHCNVNAFVNFAMGPFLSSSAAEQYAYYVLAGWVLTGGPAPDSANFARFSGRTLTPAQQQAALRYAAAFYRRYCL